MTAITEPGIFPALSGFKDDDRTFMSAKQTWLKSRFPQEVEKISDIETKSQDLLMTVQWFDNYARSLSPIHWDLAEQKEPGKPPSFLFNNPIS